MTTDPNTPDPQDEPDDVVDDDAGTDTPDEEKLTPEQLRAELAKVRREAAAKRVSNKELDAKLKEYEEWKKSQMSEAERLKAERDELAAKVAATDKEKLQRDVAREAKLSVKFADRIRGNTREEMLEDAKALAKDLPAAGGANALMAGNRGTAVGAGAARSEDEWFRELFNKAK